jgi:phage terminase large subunit
MHWLTVKYLDRENDPKASLRRFHFHIDDNTFLPVEFVENLKHMHTGLWYKRYIEGMWVVAEGAVYDMWDPERHVRPAAKLPAVTRLLAVGIDYGTTHPTRGYLLGISDEERPRLVVTDEWAPATATDAGLSADYRRWVGAREPEWVCVDPAAASFKLQLFTDGISNVMNANNAVLSGIRIVASLLDTDRLVVSGRCRELVQRLPSYSWDPKATARGEDAPVKAFDDECDALRYAIASTRTLWGALVPMTITADPEEPI